MKLSLQEKLDCDMALSVSELMIATGKTRKMIKALKPPMVCGRCRLSEFWLYYHELKCRARLSAILVE